MKSADLALVNAERRARRAVVQVSDLASGQSRVIVAGDSVEPPLREPVQKALRTGKSASVELDGQILFINAHLPPARIVVIGAVHISQALSAMATIVGFDLRIMDPRTAFASKARFENVDLVAEWPEDALLERPLDAFCALVAVTHDPKIDDFPIAAALKAGCFYVGALGSRKTHAKRVERLKTHGLSDEVIAKISAPIGLDIGASSPQEIAVAIMAEIIAALRGRVVLG